MTKFEIRPRFRKITKGRRLELKWKVRYNTIQLCELQRSNSPDFHYGRFYLACVARRGEKRKGMSFECNSLIGLRCRFYCPCC